jgi:hypothetical protein
LEGEREEEMEGEDEDEDKDAFAGLEGEREEEMEGEKDATSGVSYTLLGSAGVIAPSGQAYITQVYGSSG